MGSSRLWIGIVLASGCGFSITGGASATGDGAIDGRTGDSPPGVCPWSYTPEYLDPCPAKDGPTLELETGNSVLDTDAGTLTADGTQIPIESEVLAGARVVWTRGMHVGGDAELRVVGSLPVVFVSTSAITIAGEIDARGQESANGNALLPRPAGANPAACMTAGAGVGQPCGAEGGSGGGGGGFAELGGQGGGGGDGRTCDANNTDGMPGGTGGAAVPARPTTLRGGCPGADGGLSLAAGAIAGRGGSGGGAVALVARDVLTISGTINAGGAGGSGSKDRSGAGGGGSGGMIVLEGSTVVVSSDGRIAANGGGGGGGCDGNTGDDGEDGHGSSAAAQGGAHEGAGSDGGDGGSRGHLPQSAGISSRGGGGGGGGVGFIRVHSALGNAQADVAVSFSPPPS